MTRDYQPMLHARDLVLPGLVDLEQSHIPVVLDLWLTPDKKALDLIVWRDVAHEKTGLAPYRLTIIKDKPPIGTWKDRWNDMIPEMTRFIQCVYLQSCGGMKL